MLPVGSKREQSQAEEIANSISHGGGGRANGARMGLSLLRIEGLKTAVEP